ncbi:MAG: hypothetical protein K0R90_1509 [Oscillospiraceae bacterium]|jgi:hypothetical protein|nr:hypothetical protein [Oscillospiraceae bacterium]
MFLDLFNNINIFFCYRELFGFKHQHSQHCIRLFEDISYAKEIVKQLEIGGSKCLLKEKK